MFYKSVFTPEVVDSLLRDRNDNRLHRFHQAEAITLMCEVLRRGGEEAFIQAMKALVTDHGAPHNGLETLKRHLIWKEFPLEVIPPVGPAEVRDNHIVEWVPRMGPEVRPLTEDARAHYVAPVRRPDTKPRGARGPRGGNPRVNRFRRQPHDQDVQDDQDDTLEDASERHQEQEYGSGR
jgi:hypothetical protein